ncbi:hypothetical protein N9X04_00310 [bacterium]|nr:hypothetical protein [bacterium]
MSRSYVIINTSELSSVDFNQVLETSADTLRYSIDGSKTFVKYEGTQPFFLLGKTEYTHEEILTILSGPEWASDEIN